MQSNKNQQKSAFEIKAQNHNLNRICPCCDRKLGFFKVRSVNGYIYCSQKCLTQWKQDLKKEKAKNNKAKEIEEKAKKQKQRENKLKVAAKIPKLSVLDAGQVALQVANRADFQVALPVIKILDRKTEIDQVLHDINNKLIADYTREIMSLYETQEISVDASFFDIQLKADLDRCMSLGMNVIRKNAGFEVELSNPIGNKIEKNKTWKDIQKDFG